MWPWQVKTLSHYFLRLLMLMLSNVWKTVWCRFWSKVWSLFCCRCTVDVMKLNLSPDSEDEYLIKFCVKTYDMNSVVPLLWQCCRFCSKRILLCFRCLCMSEGGFLVRYLWNSKLCMLPSWFNLLIDFRSIFVFTLGPFLSMVVAFFGFNGNFIGKTTKINKIVKKSLLGGSKSGVK